MKKIFKIVFLAFMIFNFADVKANEDIKPYVNCTIMWKWYDGADKWSKQLDSPVGCEVDTSLIEGVDYVREYSFTNIRNYSPEDLSYWKVNSLGMSDPGFIWENIRGIGDYYSEISVRHEIYTAIFIYAENANKKVGESDPKFTYKIVMHNNNPNDITDYFDITFEREEGEKIGEYKIKPIITKKKSIPDSQLIYTNGMAIGDETGRVYIYPREGKLTIEENKTYKVTATYVDEDNNLLSDDITLEGEIGDTYTLEEKEIDGYQLLKIDGKKEGTFDNKDKNITFIYKKNITEVANIIEPPQTGYSPKSKYFLFFIVLFISFLVVSKIIKARE